MRLGDRTARRHETVGAQRSAGVNPSDYWDYAPGTRVMTTDGYPGVVTAVLDGPVAGNEAYQVTLDGGMGGGQYVTGQLRPMHGSVEAAQAATQHTADTDYPELSDILASRPDPALDQVLGRRMASLQAQAIEYSPEIEESELADPALDELDPQAVDPSVDHQLDHAFQPQHVGCVDDYQHHEDPNASDYPAHGDPGSLGHGSDDSGSGSHTASAGPYELLSEASIDTDLRFHLTASWRDVRAKAKRIRSEGGVHIKLAEGGIVVADVQGDSAIYETGIQRHPGRHAVAQYSCGCKWGSYHWGAQDDLSRFAGRMCSHALALQYEAQSRGMFGKSVYEDSDTPAWLKRRRVVVKYDIDDHENITRAAALSEPPALALVAAATGRGDDLQALSLLLSVAGIQAAVNNAWGEPTPAPVSYQPGPTTPNNPFENPASAGPLSGADPKSWQQLRPQTRVKPSLDRMSTLNEEPEPALPSTDGDADGHDRMKPIEGGTPPTSDAETMPYGYDDLTEFREDHPEMSPHTAGLDDAMFEPELAKTANPALLLAAGEAIGGAGGVARAVAPTLPGLMGGGESTGAGADEDAGSQTGEEAIQSAHSHASLDQAVVSPDEMADDEFMGVESPHGATASLQDAQTTAEVIAAFQATAGHIMSGGQAASDGAGQDVATAAREHLAKVSSKDFTAAEQAALINEGVREGVRARNLSRLDVRGTHYEHLPEEDDFDSFI